MPMPTNRNHQRGIALVLSLLLTLMMSVLAASLMFLSQTETYASMNYRMMSQARFGAESGVHKAVNFLLYQYRRAGRTRRHWRTAYRLRHDEIASRVRGCTGHPVRKRRDTQLPE